MRAWKNCPTSSALRSSRAASCAADADFNVDVGTFVVHGPVAIQDGAGATTILSCDFEDLTSAGCRIWSQFNESANLVFWHGSGSTPTLQTGPSGAQGGSYYMYIEAGDTGAASGHEAFLATNQSLGNGASVSFWYHMYGANVGALRLEVLMEYGVSWVKVWSATGEQSSAWRSASVDLSLYAGQGRGLRFAAVRGAGDKSDIALDTVVLDKGPNLPGGWAGSNYTAVVSCATQACVSSWSTSGSNLVVQRDGYANRDGSPLRTSMGRGLPSDRKSVV